MICRLFAFALLAAACTEPRRVSAPAGPTEGAAVATTDAEELRAFAKLYGYIRFFHPSDEAAAADWNLVAIEGARRVVQGRTQPDLIEALREIFEPVAPTLVLYREGALPPPAPPPGAGAVMAWQHEGMGTGDRRSPYRSARTGRPLDAATIQWWSPVVGGADGADVRGKRVRLRGWARIDGDPGARAQLWLRIDGKRPEIAFFENMEARPIVSASWQAATIESPPLGADARAAWFGGMTTGSGSALFDDFVLEVAEPGGDKWTPIPIWNPGFEAGEHPDGWATTDPGSAYSVVREGRQGGAALKIHGRADLFDERPALGETFDRSLGAGLACRVVLGLPVTAPPERPVSAPQGARPSPGAEDPAVRAAAVVVAWNVLRHFYPYHDVIGEDWNAVLDDAVADVLDDEGPGDLELTLRRLLHRLHDGHAYVRGPTPRPRVLPIRIAHVEGVYVLLSADPATGMRRGDELLSIDGVPIAELHARRAGLLSGTPRFIDHLLFVWGLISEGPDGTRATVELRRGGAALTVTATRTVGARDTPAEFDRPAIEKLAGGVFYVDLDRATDTEMRARMPDLAKAPGVVFDLRGYPRSPPRWLGHLLRFPDRAKWNFVPHIVRPDYQRVTSFTESGWNLMPLAPHISGAVAFITGPGAASYAESVMGMVEGYRLGAIVGASTAGVNGNVNSFTVPGGFEIFFTGLKVTRLDGRQHHLVGVQPTHPVSRTLAGIRAGRDEELEAALALVRPSRKRR